MIVKSKQRYRILGNVYGFEVMRILILHNIVEMAWAAKKPLTSR